MTESSYDNFDDHDDDDHEYDDPIIEWNLYDAVVDYFCLDQTGDVDDLEFSTDEEYYQHPEYIKKYGFFDDMFAFIDSADSLSYIDTHMTVKLYLEHTPSPEVSTSALCYFMFRSHIDRYIGYALPTENEQPENLTSADHKDNAWLSRWALLEQSGDTLNDEQVLMLADIEKRYSVFDLYFASEDILNTYYEKPKHFKHEEFNAAAMELVRIGSLASVKDILDYYVNIQYSNDKQQINLMRKRAKPFVRNSLDFMTCSGQTDNPSLAKDMNETQDRLLDLLLLVSPPKNVKHQKNTSGHKVQNSNHATPKKLDNHPRPEL